VSSWALEPLALLALLEEEEEEEAKAELDTLWYSPARGKTSKESRRVAKERCKFTDIRYNVKTRSLRHL